MVDIKTAVAAAVEFAKNSLGSERTENIRLEEIESSDVNGKEVWLITLSNALAGQGPLALMRAAAGALGADTTREYKVFAVAKSNGEVISMKIRLLAAPAMK